MDTGFVSPLVCLTAGAFAVALVGGVLPFVCTEVYLAAAVAVVPEGYPVWTLALAAACGQMAGKSVLYWGAAGARACLRPRPADARRAANLRQRLANGKPWATAVVTFTSALAGLPPLYVVALAAGMLGTRFTPFLMAGLTGRAMRMLAVVFVAAALRDSVA
jgi:membrane protein YqaA with SNARE-associated domain